MKSEKKKKVFSPMWVGLLLDKSRGSVQRGRKLGAPRSTFAQACWILVFVTSALGYSIILGYLDYGIPSS